MAYWYLIHTKAKREAIAEANLARQGYEVYYPRLLRPTRIRERWTDRISSLFPRYLFLRLTVGQQSMEPVRSTIGVANIVRFGYTYTVIPDVVVETLRTKADSETGLHHLGGQHVFIPGSNVRIIAGVFDGLEGVFECESGDERVVVLLKLLGQYTPVQIPAAFVLSQSEASAPLIATHEYAS